ncbi:MAG: serine protease [Candidatus Omnitrophota bacterium]|nr:serine protease [Candidatus Omnitrophota bacterium]
MITTNIIQRVFLLRNNGGQGTSFTVEHKNKQFLISAKHIFANINDGEDAIFSIYHANSWEALTAEVHYHPNLSIDIAVIDLAIDLSPRHKLEATEANIILGQDVFFLGFPYGMFTDSNTINNGFPFPFVKKAICSSLTFNASEGGRIYLDGHNNPGFSGGPVVFQDIHSKKLKVCGVISGYISQKGEIVSPAGNLEYTENAGIVICHSIKHAKEIIDAI